MEEIKNKVSKICHKYNISSWDHDLLLNYLDQAYKKGKTDEIMKVKELTKKILEGKE